MKKFFLTLAKPIVLLFKTLDGAYEAGAGTHGADRSPAGGDSEGCKGHASGTGARRRSE